jgi:hypothetical protein
VARLISEEERSRPLRLGDSAPVFTLPSYGGPRISSAECLQLGPFVDTFYRGSRLRLAKVDTERLQKLVT